jgi:hypothetical protein
VPQIVVDSRNTSKRRIVARFGELEDDGRVKCEEVLKEAAQAGPPILISAYP